MNTIHFKEPETPDPHGSAREVVIREVSSWKGVSTHEHRFGGIEFRLSSAQAAGRGAKPKRNSADLAATRESVVRELLKSRELGHLHPLFADLPLPRHLRDETIALGWAKPHHVRPDSGWVTVPMRTPSEAENVIAVFRLNHERAASATSERRRLGDLSSTERKTDD